MKTVDQVDTREKIIYEHILYIIIYNCT